jgi:hypothetical protein
MNIKVDAAEVVRRAMQQVENEHGQAALAFREYIRESGLDPDDPQVLKKNPALWRRIDQLVSDLVDQHDYAGGVGADQWRALRRVISSLRTVPGKAVEDVVWFKGDRYAYEPQTAGKKAKSDAPPERRAKIELALTDLMLEPGDVVEVVARVSGGRRGEKVRLVPGEEEDVEISVKPSEGPGGQTFFATITVKVGTTKNFSLGGGTTLCYAVPEDYQPPFHSEIDRHLGKIRTAGFSPFDGAGVNITIYDPNPFKRRTIEEFTKRFNRTGS